MSNLIKALKRAEADRQSALATGQTVPADVASEDTAVRSGGEELSGRRPIPRRDGREDKMGTAAVSATTARSPYRGVWVTLALAVATAAGFGYWLRGLSGPKALTPTSLNVAAPSPVTIAAPNTIPAVLGVHEAGPLQLQLDRRVDALGSFAAQGSRSR